MYRWMETTPMANAAWRSTGTRIMEWMAPFTKRSTRGHLQLGQFWRSIGAIDVG